MPHSGPRYITRHMPPPKPRLLYCKQASKQARAATMSGTSSPGCTLCYPSVTPLATLHTILQTNTYTTTTTVAVTLKCSTACMHKRQASNPSAGPRKPRHPAQNLRLYSANLMVDAMALTTPMPRKVAAMVSEAQWASAMTLPTPVDTQVKPQRAQEPCTHRATGHSHRATVSRKCVRRCVIKAEFKE